MKIVKTKENLISSNKIHLFLYLLIVWSLAVVQPLMALLGEQPVFFIAHEIRGWSFIFMTIIFNFFIPIFLWFILVIIGFFSTFLKEWLARLIVATFSFLIFIPFIKNLQTELVLLFGFLFSIITIFCLVKISVVKTFAQWFSIASLAFMYMFVFMSPSKQLLPINTIKNDGVLSQADGPVFIFILDEFPLISLLKSKDQIDESRFPTFASLSKSATWYPNAKAISNATSISLPAILSGIKPTNPLKAGIFEQYPNNLFTYLSNTHAMNVVENTTRMCPEYLCKSQLKNKYQILLEDTFVTLQHYLYPQDLKHKLPAINDRWIGYMREIKTEKTKGYDFSERLNKFNNFISSFDQPSENTLHLLHVLLPHAPWRILPDLKLYGFYEKEGVAGEIIHDYKDKPNIPHQWGNDSWATQLSWRRHLLQIGAIDSLIGKAIKKIKLLGLYDKSTIIVVSDHGTSFLPGISRRYAHSDNIPDIASIPLFIKFPFQTEGKKDQRIANNLDILPTLMGLFNITPINQVDGISLIAEKQRNQELEITQEFNATLSLPENYQWLFNQHIKEKEKLFPGNGWKGIFQSEDIIDIYNKDVGFLKISKTKVNAIELVNENLFENIINEGQYIPAYYRIRYLLDDKSIHQILVTLNDKIISHCYMFKHSENNCAGLIDPGLFDVSIGNKNNDFRFFSVINKDDKLNVEELLLNVKKIATIQTKPNSEFIEFNDGTSISINSNGAPYGSVSFKLTENNSIYLLDGWAGDTNNGRVAKKIYVFIDDKLFTSTDVGVPKKYLYEKFGHKSLVDSGFRVSIPVDLFPNIQNHTIRVFASINDKETTELYYVAKENEKLNKSFGPQKKRKTPINHEALLIAKIAEMELNKSSIITTIDVFNEEFKLLSAGDWYKPSKNRRWIGAKSFIVMPVAKDVKSLVLNIHAKPLLQKGMVDSQIVNIYINNKLIQKIEFKELSEHTLNLEIEQLPEDGLVTVLFEMPNAISPSAMGKSGDKRNLSLFLSKLTITPNKK